MESTLILLAWITICVVWVITATRVKRTVRIEPYSSRIGHVLTFAIAAGLLFSPSLRIGPLAWRAFPPSEIAAAVGLALTLCGISFALWARFYLKGNWSAMVALKEDHTLIRTGPYAIVRHPIYAGLLLAMLGTAIAFGELGCFLGVILALAGWLAKARMEEDFLLQRFGGTYSQYSHEVKTLIPFVL
jgi:protein-S-isoprenylcysteine O-methyltransferase Ste14